jgi:hypothetical protein
MHGMDPAEAAKPRRRWRTISLRASLLLVALVAVLLGRQVDLARAQRQAVTMMENSGGILIFDDEIDDEGEIRPISAQTRPAFDRWLMRTLGDDYVRRARYLWFSPSRDRRLTEVAWLAMEDLPDLVHVDLQEMDLGDEHLAILRRYPRLRYLDLGGNGRITDAGLAHLAGLRDLRHLNLNRTAIGDAGLARLRALSRLEWLGLRGTLVSDAGLAPLRGMLRLRLLNLSEAWIGDAGLTHLEGLTRLEWLSLRQTRVGDDGLGHLAGLTALENLDLASTHVGDAGLARLGRLVRLEALLLDETRVSVASLPTLEGFPRLRHISLPGTWVGSAIRQDGARSTPTRRRPRLGPWVSFGGIGPIAESVRRASRNPR